jgi:hypothetical protein
MPMEFSSATLLQVLLGTRDIMTLRKIRDNLFSDPATGEDVGLGVGEGPFQIGHISVVCVLLAQVIRVLQVKGLVGATCRNWWLAFDSVILS